jgi:hypothetical protein
MMAAGTISRDAWNRLITDMHTLEMEARIRTGDERSAATNKQGYQKTPAFIYALFQEALHPDLSKTSFKPRGAFTDVGLHTGGLWSGL